jgi:hypothetical protein
MDSRYWNIESATEAFARGLLVVVRAKAGHATETSE